MKSEQIRDATTRGHEPLEANVGAVWRAGAGLAGVVLVSFVLVAALMRFYAGAETVALDEPSSRQVPMTPGIPVLSPNQPAELQELRRRERRVLDGYGWTDRAAGVARIPIERAMDILSTDGLPDALPASAPGGHNSVEDGQP